MLTPIMGEFYANLSTIIMAVPISVATVALAAATDADSRQEMKRIAGAIAHRIRISRK
jgi:hypothetical protein